MKELMDHHVHSSFSPDSIEDIKNYLNKSSLLITTEHLDFDDKNYNKDIILDYKKYSEHVDKLNSSSDIRVFKGIEIGYRKAYKDNIKEYIYNNKFDLKILSIHQDDNKDYMLKIKEGDINKEITNYYNFMLDGIKEIKDINILGHIGYCFRNNIINLENIKFIDELLYEILLEIKRNDIILEINTRDLFQYKNLYIYDHIIDIYKEIGGKLFILGSDAHSCNMYKYKFKSALNYLSSKSIENIVNYNGEFKLLKIYDFI